MKHGIAAAALVLMTTPSFADDNDHDWFGVYGMLYELDNDKPTDISQFDDGDGTGIGIEYGIRFNSDWAMRLEATQIDYDLSRAIVNDSKGTLFGVDAMYFVDPSDVYIFGGLRHQDFADDYEMLAGGLGKHWHVSSNFRVITEIAGYQGLGDDFFDYSLKLGIAYVPGAKPAPRQVDSDKDGVFDNRDLCPNTPRGVSVDNTGCPLDSDRDGVTDDKDQCPNTPIGYNVDAKGCQLLKDSDKDGVPDDKDQCPNTPMNDAVYPDNGCTIFAEQKVSTNLEILFANNSDEVTNPDAKVLQDFAAFMTRYGTTSVTIEGHSSAVGAAAYNKALSLRRAKAVKAVLVNDYGIDGNRISTIGYGEEQLLDTSNTAAAHKLNRRIVAEVVDTVKVPEKR